MIKKSIFSSGLLFVIIFSATAQPQKQNPVIKNYGGVFANVPGVTFKADKQLDYKVVMEVDESDTGSTKVCEALEYVSRYINLLAIDGIADARRSVVVIFHSAGAYCIQTNEAYQRKYGIPNPNLKVFDELSKAGVSFYVCGQSTVRRKIPPTDIISDVKIATSYLTSYTTFQLKGYATLKM